MVHPHLKCALVKEREYTRVITGIVCIDYNSDLTPNSYPKTYKYINFLVNNKGELVDRTICISPIVILNRKVEETHTFENLLSECERIATNNYIIIPYYKLLEPIKKIIDSVKIESYGVYQGIIQHI